MSKKNVVVVKASPIADGGIEIRCEGTVKTGLNTIEAFIYLGGLLRKGRNVKITMDQPTDPNLRLLYFDGRFSNALSSEGTRSHR